MTRARRAILRQAYVKFCEETSDCSGKGAVMEIPGNEIVLGVAALISPTLTESDRNCLAR